MTATHSPPIVLADGSDEAAWLDARRRVVTATDVARLKTGGAQTWSAIRAEKAGTAPRFSNRALEHGKEREPEIARYAERTFGLVPSKSLLAAADRPQFAATPDAIGIEGVGEFKTTAKDWQSIDDVPRRYLLQMQWQMRVTGLPFATLVFEPHEDYVPLYPDPKFFVVGYDAEIVADLEAIADEFLEAPNEYSDSDAELDALLTSFVKLDEVATIAREKADAAKSRIEHFLGGVPTRFEGSRANLTRSADGVQRRFDLAAFKKADPAVFESFQVETPVKGALRITARPA